MAVSPLKIATYNLNGIDERLPRLLEWLDETRPDVVCLQGLKSAELGTPDAAVRSAGYEALWDGQQEQGIAILSRREAPQVVRRGLPGDLDDSQSRYLEANVQGLRIASLDLPNGNPQPGPKFDYKLAWSERLIVHAQRIVHEGVDAILAGDFNVVPTDFDIYNPWVWQFDAILQPEIRDSHERLLGQGWVDATRRLHPRERVYTFWIDDVMFRQNAGFRMDFLLVSPGLASRLERAGVDSAYRAREGASDHAPVWCQMR